MEIYMHDLIMIYVGIIVLVW